MAKTLQQQGVPWQSSLRGRQAKGPTPRRRTVRDRTPLNGQMGGTRDTTTYYDYPESDRPNRSNRNRNRSYNPASIGSSAGSGVAGLEAEFLLAIVLLILLMFANSQASYGERIMSLIKRGSLTCLLFFILALVASSGPNAAKIAKGFGALIIVAILITSPMNTVLTDVDNVIKNDWVGTGASSGSGSADSGTSTGTSNPANTSGASSAPGIASDAKQALVGTLNGIIPGLGSILSKFGI